MAAAFGRDQFKIKEIGREVTVPNSPTAILMYYLGCVCRVLDLEDNESMQRYREFSNYGSMTTQDKHVIVSLCRLFDPRILNDKVFFHSEDFDNYLTNQFYEIGHVRTRVAAVDGLVIGGIRVRATKVMLFKASWMKTNYINALTNLISELSRPEVTYRSNTRRSSDDCIIL